MVTHQAHTVVLRGKLKKKEKKNVNTQRNTNRGTALEAVNISMYAFRLG